MAEIIHAVLQFLDFLTWQSLPTGEKDIYSKYRLLSDYHARRDISRDNVRGIFLASVADMDIDWGIYVQRCREKRKERSTLAIDWTRAGYNRSDNMADRKTSVTTPITTSTTTAAIGLCGNIRRNVKPFFFYSFIF